MLSLVFITVEIFFLFSLGFLLSSVALAERLNKQKDSNIKVE